MNNTTVFQRISIDEAASIMARKDVLVFDVRDKASFDSARIGAAQHLSSANLDAVIFSAPKTVPVLIYCYHGNASQIYAQMFGDFGFREVYSMDGGFDAWSKMQTIPQALSLSEPLQRWLIEQGYPPDSVDATGAHGLTPLMKASRQADATIVAELIQSGARIDIRNADGNNVLWLACVGENLEIINLLIQCGVDIDHQNDNGATCLMYAASTGKANVVEALLAAGAATHLKTLDDFSALDMAASLACLQLLRNAERKAKTTSAQSEEANEQLQTC
jgi:rhodanese-related sulfurtransferase